ncbi:signal protein [Verrucomicrobia bacterium LW23]|nr:signal protein [Verrucomicrobia bacterium LW23]PTY04334.1 signal protein [Verrucomicrobia bacterium LW23]
MNLTLKFNLIFFGVFALGLSIASYFAYNQFQENARRTVIDQAGLMMETTLATRAYTSTHIASKLNTGTALMNELKSTLATLKAAPPELKLPENLDPATRELLTKQYKDQMAKLEETRKRVEATVTKSETDYPDKFIAETVPAFAATSNFDFLRKKYPEYTYKEATLNPTNPLHKASDWEAEVVNTFRNNPDKKDHFGQRHAEGIGETLYLARPLKIVDPNCLRCHDTPERAPATMLRDYPQLGGFGWKLNEIIGAQIVSVPMSVPVNMANNAFYTLVTSLTAMFVVVSIILNILLYFTVILPARRLSEMANDVSNGNMDAPELPVNGSDEISTLTDAFNRMYRSLAKAMKMLEG